MTTKFERPQILLDLDFKESYRINNIKIKVEEIKEYEYPAYAQTLDRNIRLDTESPNGFFNITSFQMNNSLTLIKKIDNVTKVTVFFDIKKNNVLLFEVLSYREENKVFYRYFAIKNFGKEEDRWVEYMFRTSQKLDKKHIKTILKESEKKDFLNNVKIDDTYLSIVQVYSLRSLPSNGYIKMIEKPVYNGKFVRDDSGYKKEFKSFQGADGIPFTLSSDELTDMNQIEEQKERQEEKKEFLKTNTGMTTVVASGSVGGAAIGGTLIYLINNFR